MPGTPAVEAGLKSGDVITTLNGKAVEDAADLTLRIGSFKPGDKVDLTYMRDGAEKTAQVTLADQKNETVAKAEELAIAEGPRRVARHPGRAGKGGPRLRRKRRRHRQRRSERRGRGSGLEEQATSSSMSPGSRCRRPRT